MADNFMCETCHRTFIDDASLASHTSKVHDRAEITDSLEARVADLEDIVDELLTVLDEMMGGGEQDPLGGRRWAGRRWAGRRWAGRRWAGRRWAGRRWAADE